MSAIALVLISTEPGQEQQVVADLKVMREVSEAMVLFGEYDVYCKVVVDDFSNNVRTHTSYKYMKNLVVCE